MANSACADDEVRARSEHLSVGAGNGVARGNRLIEWIIERIKTLWQGFADGRGMIGQQDFKGGLWILVFELDQGLGSHGVKMPAAADNKTKNMKLPDMVFSRFFDGWLQGVGSIMTA